MNAQIAHTDVASYALGLLEEPDRRAYEAHLATCASCAAELAALSDVARTLAAVPREAAAPPVEPDPAIVTDLVRHRARLERKRRRSRVLLTAAAGVLLAAAAGTAGAVTAGDRSAEPGTRSTTQAGPPPAASTRALLDDGRRFSATDSVTGVSGSVAMEPKTWGSRVAMELTKVRGPLECQLLAIDRTGEARLVVGWSVPKKGYGFPGGPPSLVLEGGSAIKPGQIAKFQVRTTAGRTLVTIPA